LELLFGQEDHRGKRFAKADLNKVLAWGSNRERCEMLFAWIQLRKMIAGIKKFH
jgi:hypothetical protein